MSPIFEAKRLKLILPARSTRIGDNTTEEKQEAHLGTLHDRKNAALEVLY